jgi:hypothetical protein
MGRGWTPCGSSVRAYARSKPSLARAKGCLLEPPASGRIQQIDGENDVLPP